MDKLEHLEKSVKTLEEAIILIKEENKATSKLLQKINENLLVAQSKLFVKVNKSYLVFNQNIKSAVFMFMWFLLYAMQQRLLSLRFRSCSC
jgi:hypothetical protein